MVRGGRDPLSVVDDDWSSLPGWCPPAHATLRSPGLTSWGEQCERVARWLGYERLWGWQRQVLDVGTELTDEGLWRWRRIAVVVPRQNGKTTLLSVLSAMYLMRGLQVMYAAQSREQAYRPWSEAVERIEQGMPGLIDVVRRGNGRETATSSSGGSLRLGTPVAKSVRGSVLDLVLLDEALELDPEFVAMLRPTQTTRPMAQTWYLSSAGHGSSTVLRRVRAQAIAQVAPYDTALFEWAADADAARTRPDDHRVWGSCIPTLGQPGGARVEAVESARQDMMPDEFAREYLGQWSDPEADAPIQSHLWAAARKNGEGNTFEGKVVLGVDVGPGSQHASICAAGRSESGRIRVELIEHRMGTSWVEARVGQLCRRHRPVAIIADERSPAAVLFDDLVRMGWPLERIDWVTVIRSSARFVSLLERGDLEVGNGPPLDAAAATAVRRQIGAGWGFQRGTRSTDISPLVAAVLAADRAAQVVEMPLMFMPSSVAS